MRILIIGLLASVLLVSCKNQKRSGEIIIEGQVKDLPDGMLYLAEAVHWKKPLDSAQCRNGHFLFTIKSDSTFVPYRAAIHFRDTTRPGEVGTLFFHNHTIGADSNNYSVDAFYAEQGYTRIEGDARTKQGLRIFAGRETDMLFSNQGVDFGWLDYIDTMKRSQRLRSFENEIKQHPFSYFLLESILSFKEQYSKEEMEGVLSLFDKKVRESKLGDTIRTYLAYRPGRNEPIRSISLINSKKERLEFPANLSTLNMLVFWASWCGPCRREIPTLKEIYLKYKEQGFNMVSISIDEKETSWQQALAEEEMGWEQYIIDPDQLNIIQQQYNFSAIPFTIFIDSVGKEIKRFSGYDGDSKEEYVKLIIKTLETK